MSGPYTLGSLFAGVGCFDLAAERVGMRVAWQAEIEPFACRVLAHRFPGVPNLGDVTRIEDAPHVDVVTFGFPCQDISGAGKRGGLDGARSGLFYEAVQIIERVRPAIAIAENVAGLLSSNRGRDLAAVLGALADIGAMDIGWRVLDAQHVGGCALHGRGAVPQRRRRIFLVADFAGRRAAQILALSEGGARHPAPRREAGQATAATLRSRSSSPGVSYPGRGGEDDDNLVYTIHNGQGDPNYDINRSLCLDAQSPPAVTVAPCDTGRYGKGTDSEATDALIVADLAQITSKANRTRVEADSPNSTLAANSQMIVANALTVSNGHHGHSSPRGDGVDNLIPFTNRGEAIHGAHETLRAASHGALPMVATAPLESPVMRYNSAYGGDSDGDTTQAHAGEILRAVRDAVGEEAFQGWALRGLGRIQETQVLRSDVHGTELRRATAETGHPVWFGPLAFAESDPERGMPTVRRGEGAGCPPSEWRLEGSLRRELDSVVQELSSPGASQAAALRGLWEASEGLGLLRAALSEIQAMGRSAEDRLASEEAVRAVRANGEREGTVRSPLHAGEASGDAADVDNRSAKGAGAWGVRRLMPL